jgi:O-methyltransferase involved in polyketide biosynthesis
LAGYFKDPFSLYFCPRSAISCKKQPLTNLGTWLRTAFLDEAVCEFLAKHGQSKCQVINLGAGYDTRFFRLLENIHRQKDSSFAVLWYEIDYAYVLREKKRILEKNNISTRLPIFLPLDLNALDSLNDASCCFDKTIPTLVLAECIFTYLLPERVFWLLIILF